jgi:hypothetical protein
MMNNIVVQIPPTITIIIIMPIFVDIYNWMRNSLTKYLFVVDRHDEARPVQVEGILMVVFSVLHGPG